MGDGYCLASLVDGGAAASEASEAREVGTDGRRNIGREETEYYGPF